MMILFYLIFSISPVFGTYQSSIDDAGCGICVKARMSKYENKLYYFENHFKLTWFEAFCYCRYKGMKLLTIDSAMELKFIRNEIQNTIFPNENYWSSATDLGHPGIYKWMPTGLTLQNSSLIWAKGSPENTTSDEHCTYLKATSNLNISVTDCNKQLYTICKTVLCKIF